MRNPTLLIHHGAYQPLWQQTGLIQVGPKVGDGPDSMSLIDLSGIGLLNALKRRGWPRRGVLMQYTDPFLLRIAPMRGIREWPGPKILACGDLHHGPDPIGTLQRYCSEEPHDAVLLTFNPALAKRCNNASRTLLGPIALVPGGNTKPKSTHGTATRRKPWPTPPTPPGARGKLAQETKSAIPAYDDYKL